MDIELAVDAMELAEHIDQMVLFSGDGDFRSLVEAVQRQGVRVTVVSTVATQPPMSCAAKPTSSPTLSSSKLRSVGTRPNARLRANASRAISSNSRGARPSRGSRDSVLEE
ncbi:hypothetical protein ABIB75_005870 [Bradyrhizobium sp. GM2.2]